MVHIRSKIFMQMYGDEPDYENVLQHENFSAFGCGTMQV